MTALAFEPSPTPLIVGREPFDEFDLKQAADLTGTFSGERWPGLLRWHLVPVALMVVLTTGTPSPSASYVPIGPIQKIPVTGAALFGASDVVMLPPPYPLAVVMSARTTAFQAVAAERALSAVADLQGWFGLTEEAVADLGGFTRRSISNWRAGSEPYPKTVRGLFEIHALVSGLARAVGAAEMRAWLGIGGTDPRRWAMLMDVSGRRNLLAEASSLLFAPAPRDPYLSQLDEDALEVMLPQPSRTPAALQPPASRGRRV